MTASRIVVWPAGVSGGKDDATSRYRLIEPARCLVANGADITIDTIGPRVLWSERWDPRLGNPPGTVHAIALAARPEADVVILQRPGRQWWAEIIPMLQKLGVRVVVDVDDAFHQIHPDNAAADSFDPRLNKWHNSDWVAEACKAADVVTVTTPHLLSRYGYGHGIVLPNLIPESYLHIDAERPLTVGWAGSVRTHPTDLQVTGGAVQRALDKNPDWSFCLLGHENDQEPVQRALTLAEPVPSMTDKWVSFEDYAPHLARTGIGIVPLADIGFNKGKSWLKMSEYAACGVPVVASPTPDNVKLNKLGVGVLAATPNQWAKRLSALMANEDHREDVAGRGREVMTGLTYEAHAERWMLAWTGSRSLMKAV